MSVFGSEADSLTVFTSCGSDELLVLCAPASVSGRAPPPQRRNHQEVISHRELKTDFIRVLRSEALDDYICWIRTQNTEHRTHSVPTRSIKQSPPEHLDRLQTLQLPSEHLSWTSLDQVHLSLGLFWTGSDGLNGSPLISVRPAPRIRSGSKLYLVMSGKVQVS